MSNMYPEIIMHLMHLMQRAEHRGPHNKCVVLEPPQVFESTDDGRLHCSAALGIMATETFQLILARRTQRTRCLFWAKTSVALPICQQALSVQSVPSFSVLFLLLLLLLHGIVDVARSDQVEKACRITIF